MIMISNDLINERTNDSSQALWPTTSSTVRHCLIRRDGGEYMCRPLAGHTTHDQKKVIKNRLEETHLLARMYFGCIYSNRSTGFGTRPNRASQGHALIFIVLLRYCKHNKYINPSLLRGWPAFAPPGPASR